MDCWKLFPNNIDILEIKKCSYLPSLSQVFPLVSSVKMDMIFLGLHFVFLERELLSGLLHINISSFQRL